jgi:hypothetical protein
VQRSCCSVAIALLWDVLLPALGHAWVLAMLQGHHGGSGGGTEILASWMDQWGATCPLVYLSDVFVDIGTG